MPYDITINFLKNKIKHHKLEGPDIDHILYMFSEIKEMENKPKAGRWIGWCLKALENIGIITNNDSRFLIKKDVEEGNE